MTSPAQHLRRAGARFIITLLAIEFLDEIVFGVREAAWPLIRDDLGLTYLQIGVLLGLPGLVSNVVEPFIGLLADTWKRRVIILGGGACFAASLALTSASRDFGLLLASFILFYPASGAFVSISQAALMDSDPARQEQNMARWTFSGSLGVVAGPLALGAAVTLGGGWRSLFAAFAGVTMILMALAWRQPFPRPGPSESEEENVLHALRSGGRQMIATLRRAETWRWLLLLEFSDLMLDVLLGFLALYLVDIAGATPAQAGIAVGVWTGFGLLGDFLLIPLLERISGLAYLRVSAVVELVLYTAFLLVPNLWIKVALLGLLGFFNAGWYAILQARLYAANPGQSGITLAAHNLAGLVGSLLPLMLGWVAQMYNLNASMALILLGPLALLVGLPRRKGGPNARD